MGDIRIGHTNGYTNGDAAIGSGHTNGHINRSSDNHTNGHMASNGAPIPNTDGSIPEPIAIVGMSMRLPGGIRTEDAFWDLLVNKKTTRGPIPHSRYNYKGFYTDSGKPGSISVRHGHFLEDSDAIDVLDTSFFNVSKAEVERLDPQQRMLLEVVWECVENAGQSNWRGSNTGVFVGAWGYDWIDFLAKDPQQVGGMLNTLGSHDYTIANRVSYEYDLQGPSMTIKTACSSSLICLHQAIQSLRNEECDAAIVAGTNLILTPTTTMEQTESGVLSPTGECRTFDASANGYARGEAINALLIKKLSKAREDKDVIRAVIRSTAVNSDGRSAGLTTPSPKAHVRLIKGAYQSGRLNDPSETPYVEVHGTGTKTGDPLELEAIAEVFGNTHDTYIGGVKANVGHSESASGVTSVIKAVLSLENRIIPPQANFSTPNPKIPFKEAKLVVPLEPIPWPEGRPERISVNSFGITGANAHAIIESAASYEGVSEVLGSSGKYDGSASELLLVSTTNAQSLKERCGQIQDYASEHPQILSDLAYTLSSRRDHLSHRAYCIHTGPDSAEFITADRSKQVPKLNFVFTGQGAQWPAMGKQLIENFPTFREDIIQLGNVLSTLPDPPYWNLLDEILRDDSKSRVNKAEFSQPLCTAIQVALVNLLRLLDIVPSGVVGHSSGEIGAAYAAGALTFEEAIAVAYYRGLVTKQSTRKGSMAAIGLNQAEARLYLENDVVIACDNSPQGVTMSGDEDALDRIIEHINLDDAEVFTRRLKTDGMAYHSHHMAEIGPIYEDVLRHVVKGRAPALGFFSTVTGKLTEGSTLGPRYWRQNLESPVQFYPAVRSMLASGTSDQLFLEIGPHSALAGPLRQIFKASSSRARLIYCPSLVRGKNARQCILDMCGQLFLQGIPLTFQALTTGSSLLTNLPTYPWNHDTSYWSENRVVKDWRMRKFPRHELLGSRILEGNDVEPAWRNMLRLKDTLWLAGHKVYGDVVFPFAGYIAMVGEAVRQLTDTHAFTIRNLSVKTAMVVQDSPVEIMTSLRRSKNSLESDKGWYEFTIISHNGSMWAEHCDGEIRAGEFDSSVYAQETLTEPLPRKIPSPYDLFHSVGLHYDGSFRGLVDVSSMPGKKTSVGSLKTPSTMDSPYALHPATMDQCLQLLGMASSEGLSRHLQRIPLPTFVEKISIQPCKSQEVLRAKAVATHISSQGDIEGRMLAMQGSTTVLVVEGCHLSAFAEEEEEILDDPVAAARASWRPHIDFVPLETLMLSEEKDANDVRTIEEYGLLCSAEILERIENTKDSNWHFTKFRKWMSDVVTGGRLGENKIVSNSKDLLELSRQERMEMIHNLEEKLRTSPFIHVAELTTRLLDNCVGIFDGTTEVLEVYRRDDTLTKLYALTGARIDSSQFFVTVGHSNPTLRVLEIGAGTGGTTLISLNALTSINNEPMYSSYTFTDISSGFFAAAKERFSEFPGLEFKILDIGRDPADQGFELGTYDLIIASNVIHATEYIGITLKNVHKLLNSRGRFFLQEVIPSSVKMKNLIMGPMPGWWLGEADGRVNEPIITVERWSKELSAAGFSGIECAVLDDPKHDAAFGANMIAKPAVSAQEYKSVTILIRPDQADTEMLKLVQRIFEKNEYYVDLCNLGEPIPPSQDIISLVDTDKPFFDQLTAENLAAFQKIVTELTSARMLWVMGSAQIKPTNSLFGTALGIIRCIRAEMSIPLGTLEIDKFDAGISNTILNVFEKFLDTTPAIGNADYEYVIDENVVKVGRYHWTTVSKELEASQDIDTLPLKLGFEGARASKLVKWVPQPVITVQTDEIVVRPMYVGIGSKDFVTLDETTVRDYCGEVVEVGSGVGRLKVGDRIIGVGCCGVQTTFKTHATSVIKIPDNLGIEDAASMPLAYATAFHCLRDLAGLKKNQTVLITDAGSAVGIAAIRICQMIGADLYCCVPGYGQTDFLNEIGIRNVTTMATQSSSALTELSFKNGKVAFDVILNVLSENVGQLCKRVAPRGKLINLGGPIAESLDMKTFTNNKTFYNVDMGEMDDVYPQLLQEVISLVQQKRIEPIRPIRVLDVEELDTALRSSVKQVSIGKLLLRLPKDRNSLPIHPAPPNLQFRSDVAYLIAGGLGGLGRATSNCMAEHGARHFIYLSRSAESSSMHQSFFRELEAQGCSFQAISCDITSYESVGKALQQATLPIAGVLQMAMVIQDRPFLSMTHEDWTTAIKPKVDGTWNLHSALLDAKIDLDFFVMFGSSSGAFGIPGQGNYAAGNSFQDAFVQYRHSLGLPASVLDIGVVSEVGYVSENKDMLDYFRTAGFPILTEGQVFETLHLSILQQYPPGKEKRTVATPTVDPGFTSRSQLTLGVRATKPMTDATNRVLFKRDRKADIYRNIQAARMNSSMAGGTKTGSGDEVAGLMASLRDAADAESVLIRPETLKLLRREIGAFIYESMLQSVEEEEMEFSRSLMSLGVDSLVTIEVRSWIRRKLDVEVSTLEMLNGGTIENLGELVLERMKGRYSEKATG